MMCRLLSVKALVSRALVFALCSACIGQEPIGYWRLEGEPSVRNPYPETWLDQNKWEGRTYATDEKQIVFGFRHASVQKEWSKHKLWWDALPRYLVPGRTLPLRIGRACILPATVDVPATMIGIAAFLGDEKLIEVTGTGRSEAANQEVAVPPGGRSSGRLEVRLVANLSTVRDGYAVTYIYLWRDGAMPDGPPDARAGPAATGPSPKPGDTPPSPAAGTNPAPGDTSAGGSPGSASDPLMAAPDVSAEVSTVALQAGIRFATPGDSVFVPIWILRANDVANMNFNLFYDAKIIRPNGTPAKENLLEGALFETNAEEFGVLRLAFAQATKLTGSGAIARIPFKVIGASGTATPLRLQAVSAYSESGTPFVPLLVHGEVRVIGPDNKAEGGSGEGRLTALEAMIALKMSVRVMTANLALDMDGDGRITANDATLILRKAVSR